MGLTLFIGDRGLRFCAVLYSAEPERRTEHHSYGGGAPFSSSFPFLRFVDDHRARPMLTHADSENRVFRRTLVLPYD